MAVQSGKKGDVLAAALRLIADQGSHLKDLPFPLLMAMFSGASNKLLKEHQRNKSTSKK